MIARGVLRASPIVLLGAALGALGGWLWWQWWSPARSGEVFETSNGPMWYPQPWDPGQAQYFAGTAEFAVVGLAAGLLLGAVAALLGRRHAFAALAGLVAGAALAAWLAYTVGTSFSAPDPQTLASTETIGDELPAAIGVSGWTPYLCWPLGGLIGFLGGTVLVSMAEDVRRRETDTTTWLERSEQSSLR